MPRSHGRIMAAIWSDGDFITMRGSAQRLFMFLLSQSDLSHAGLLPMRVNRWAKKAEDLTPKALRDELDYLAKRDFIVVDEDTEEVLIRTMVRNDGVYKQPRVMDRLREDAKQIESDLLRDAFAAELDRLPLHELSTAPSGRGGDGPSTREQVERVIDGLRHDFADSLERVSERVSETLPDTPRVRAGALPLPPTPVPQPPTPAPIVSAIATAIPDAPDRDDVERICEHLANRIEDNGAKRPTITSRWRDSARLMLDRDGLTEREVLGAIDWCQADEFWRANILSLPKLREKYDQLKLQAQRKGPPGNRQQQTDDLFDRAAKRMGVIQ